MRWAAVISQRLRSSALTRGCSRNPSSSLPFRQEMVNLRCSGGMKVATAIPQFMAMQIERLAFLIKWFSIIGDELLFRDLNCIRYLTLNC